MSDYWWSLRWPELSDFDPLTGQLVLRPACVDTTCTDCEAPISVGQPQAVADREVVCPECAAMYRWEPEC